MAKLYFTRELNKLVSDKRRVLESRELTEGNHLLEGYDCKVPITVHYQDDKSFVRIDIAGSSGKLSKVALGTGIYRFTVLREMQIERYRSVEIGVQPDHGHILIFRTLKRVSEYFLFWSSVDIPAKQHVSA